MGRWSSRSSVPHSRSGASDRLCEFATRPAERGCGCVGDTVAGRTVDVAAKDHPLADVGIPSEKVGGSGSHVDVEEPGVDGHHNASGSCSSVTSDFADTSEGPFWGVGVCVSPRAADADDTPTGSPVSGCPGGVVMTPADTPGGNQIVGFPFSA